jgi:hypothetical protein
MAYNWTTEWPSVYARHQDDCPLRNGGECTCGQVTYRASAKAPDQHSRLLSPEFATALDARDWLRDQRARLTAAIAVADEGPSVRAVIQDFLAAAERGEARERSGAEYTSSRLAQIRGGLAYVDSEIGSTPLQAVRRRHVQALVDQLHLAGLPSDRIVDVVSGFRDLFVYAIQRDLVDFNPIVQLRLPADDGRTTDEPLVTTATYAVPLAMNGNGYHTPVGVPAMQPAPAMVSEQPFEGEPTYGPPGHVAADEIEPGPQPAAPQPPPPPAQPPPAQPPPVPADELDPEPQPAPETLPPPPLQPPPVPPPYPYDTAPLAPPPPAYPYDTAPQAPPPPAYPYEAAPMFAPPGPGTRMVTPIGAETHYGTPTYGASSLPTQATVQAPRQDPPQDGVIMSEQMFWWITRIVVIVFVLIALVLAAESV